MTLKKDKIKKQALKVQHCTKSYEKVHAITTNSGINYCNPLLIGWVDSPAAFLEDVLYPGIFLDSVQGILAKDTDQLL